MNGAAYRAGRTVLDYRMRTFRAFLGLDLAGGDDAEIQDPVACFKLWQDRAANNRRLLTEVFTCVQCSQAKSPAVRGLLTVCAGCWQAHAARLDQVLLRVERAACGRQHAGRVW